MTETNSPDGLGVAEMAAVTGVTGHTLRYYERIGLIAAVGRTSGNQRRYRSEEVDWVRFLVRLRATGMPIARMREYAALRAEGATTVRSRLDMLTAHETHLREQIAALRAHERALRDKVETYRRMLAETTSDQNPDTENTPQNGETRD